MGNREWGIGKARNVSARIETGGINLCEPETKKLAIERAFLKSNRIIEIADWIFPIPDSRFPIPDSRFPIPDSRFPIPDSRFPIPDSRFPAPQ